MVLSVLWIMQAHFNKAFALLKPFLKIYMIQADQLINYLDFSEI